MPEQHVPIGGEIIHPVLELVRGRDEVGVQAVDALGQVARVDLVPGQKGEDTHHQQRYRTHPRPPVDSGA